MSNKNRKFTNATSRGRNRVVHRFRFDRHGHLIDTMLRPENSSKFEENLKNAIDFTNRNFFEEVEVYVSSNSGFVKTWNNTSIVDDDGNVVSSEAKQEARHSFIHQGINDTMKDVIENTDERYTKKTFFKQVLNNILDRLDFLRTNAEKDNKKTQENTGKSLVSRFKKVTVFAKDILSMFETDKKDTQAYEQKISSNASTVKSRILFNRWTVAAGFTSVLLFTSCIVDKNEKAPDQGQAQTEQKDSVVTKPAPIAQQASAPKQEVKDETVVVQTEYSDNLQVSENAWNSTKSFYGDKYELAYKRLSNQIMKEYFDGCTREYVLNQLRYNLTSYSEKTITEWENTINNGTEDEHAQKVVNAYRVSQQIICYLTDATAQTFPSDAKDIFIDQEKGNLDRTVESVTFRDCNIDIRYKNTKTISWEEATNIVQDSISVEEPTDTTVTQQNFVAGGGSVKVEKEVVQNDSVVAASFTYNKGDQNFDKSKELRDATATEALGRQVKSKKIMVEVADTNTSTQEPSATYNKGSNLNNGEVIKNATNEEAAAVKLTEQTVVVEKTDTATQTVVINQEGFKVLTGEETDSVAAPVAAQTNFKDLTGENPSHISTRRTNYEDLPDYLQKYIDDNLGNNSEQSETGSATDPDSTQVSVKQTDFNNLTISTTVASADSTSYEVIVGTGVEEGTLALGSVEPRGGYNHTGTLKGPEYSIKFMGGADNYELGIQNGENHKEWFARNGFAEGLTPHALVEVTAFYTEVFPYSEVTAALRKTVICGDPLSVEMSAKVKDAIDKFNLNHTIDGVQYNNPTQNVGIVDNGCDKRVTAHIEQRNVSKVTNPSGPKPLRMFIKIKQNVQEAFGIGGGSVEYVTLPQGIITQAARFTFNKSNGGFENSMKLSDVDGSKVFELRPRDRTIMFEVRSSDPTQGVATYNKSNGGFENEQTITTVPVEEATGRKPQNKKEVYIEQGVTQQAIAQQKMNTQG